LASSETILIAQRAKKLSAGLHKWAVVVDGVHAADLPNGGEVPIARKAGLTAQLIPPMGSVASPITTDARQHRTVIVSAGLTGMKVKDV